MGQRSELMTGFAIAIGLLGVALPWLLRRWFSAITHWLEQRAIRPVRPTQGLGTATAVLLALTALTVVALVRDYPLHALGLLRFPPPLSIMGWGLISFS